MIRKVLLPALTTFKILPYNVFLGCLWCLCLRVLLAQEAVDRQVVDLFSCDCRHLFSVRKKTCSREVLNSVKKNRGVFFFLHPLNVLFSNRNICRRFPFMLRSKMFIIIKGQEIFDNTNCTQCFHSSSQAI